MLREKGNSITGKVYEILKNDRKKYHTKRKAELFSYLEWMITCNALSHLEKFLQLHAGAVIKDGEKVILLPAEHGYGKTTLVANLIKNGYGCLADDIVLVDPETLAILPFPRSFLIKEDGIEKLSESNLLDKDSGYYYKDGGVLYYNPTTQIKSIVERVVPYAIIELGYDQNSRNELKPLSQHGMCLSLLKQSFNIHTYKRKGVETITRLVRESKCYSLRTNNMRDAVRLVAQI
jgi:hypothetical protein